MFNDLTKPNQPNQPSHPSVDDIFAETDKAPGPQMSAAVTPSATQPSSNTVIDAHKVGLAAAGDLTEMPVEKSGGNKWFTIGATVIVAVIIILGGYLVYIKFFAGNLSVANSPAAPVIAGQSTSHPSSAGSSLVATTSNNSLSTTTPSSLNQAANSLSPVANSVPLIPGVNAPIASSSPSDVTSSSSLAATIDSDSDGLPDVVEVQYGTNPNSADTDNDGLSDYEEIKIYHTDPLNPDTDGDGFSDSQEVKAGYNPLGAGKMINASSTPLQ